MSIIEKAVDKLSANSHRTGKGGAEVLPGAGQQAGAGPMEAGRKDAVAASVAAAAVPGARTTPVAGPPEGVVNPDISFGELDLEGILSREGGRSQLAEEYRMIKRPLLLKVASSATEEVERPANLVMVSSSLSGEGKTFTSINLAVSIAMEMDRTVLLIDADLARPGLSRLLNITERQGLTECLKDEQLDLGQFLLRTDVPKLTVLPAGQRHDRATELLASNAMRSRLHEMASRYPDRILIFDSPPLLVTSEASVLASQMGQVVMVVEFGKTAQYLVKEALTQLDDRQDVSLLLNKSRDDIFSSAGRYGYGYGYGYGKRYGYGDQEES
jgi:exopolysaccharide/PEP-CTERM locus tyrosine autokinase